MEIEIKTFDYDALTFAESPTLVDISQTFDLLTGAPDETHEKADILLCEALRITGGDKVAGIIEQFRKLTKWYD